MTALLGVGVGDGAAEGGVPLHLAGGGDGADGGGDGADGRV